MSTKELASKVKKIKELQIKADELTAEIDSLKDEIKAEMTAQGVEEMVVSCFKVSYKDVTSNRFDTTAFQQTHAALYNQYCKPRTYKRFTVN